MNSQEVFLSWLWSFALAPLWGYKKSTLCKQGKEPSLCTASPTSILNLDFLAFKDEEIRIFYLSHSVKKIPIEKPVSIIPVYSLHLY